MMTQSNNHSTQGESKKSVWRVLIADDHDIVRRGLRSVVESRPGWEVVAETGDGREALTLAVSFKPDIAIIDYSMPMMNGAQLAHRIRAESPETQVLIFTMHENEAIMREALIAGARGFLVKSDADQQLYAALDALAHRKPFFTGQVSEELLALYLSRPTDAGELGLLTPREKEVIQLIAEGNSSRVVGEILNISTKTAEAHRSAAMKKLQINSTAMLVRYAIRNKMLEP